MTDTRTFNSEERAKLQQLIREGSTVMQEVEDLQGSLTDTIKSVAEELQIKSSLLKKAISVAHKGSFGQQADDHSMLENILHAVGRLDDNP